MKFFLQEEAGKGAAGAAGAAPDVAKIIGDHMKGLGDEIKKLNQRIDQAVTKPAPAKKEQAPEEDLSDLILLDPKKAVEKITTRVKEAVSQQVSEDTAAKDQFNTKFNELQADFPEIADQSSELHLRAKEILATSTTKGWDAAALERAVLKAASEKGVQAVKHRRQTSSDDDAGDDYLGSGARGGSGRENSRRNRSEKLPSATLAFAEACGMDIKDTKLVERLTKTHNERKGNWHKYK